MNIFVKRPFVRRETGLLIEPNFWNFVNWLHVKWGGTEVNFEFRDFFLENSSQSANKSAFSNLGKAVGSSHFFLLSGVPDYFGRNKISSGGDLSHYSSASLY